jgi:hypothetical protein
MSWTGSRLPTPASRADVQTKAIQAPPWLAWLLTPLLAAQVARELQKRYPGLGAAEIAEKMRAETPAGVNAEKFIDAVVARLPGSADKAPAEKPISAWVLVAANLLPLYGVLFWNWEAFPLLALFWMENAIIGVLNAARMLVLDPGNAALWAGKLFMVPFFCFHYGMFTTIHGLFVFSMFGGYPVDDLQVLAPAARAVADWNLWLPLAALAASHLFSFFWNFLYRGEYRRASLSEQMMRPYGRVVVLHLAILLGGFAAMALGSPLWALLVLLGVKIAVDLTAHLKEHRS